MVRNMPKLETQEAIDFEASLTKANGTKMVTCHLEARMAKTVRFPKYRSRADFDKSKASKETFGQQLRRRSEEESAKLDSRNATSTGRSIGGTESLTDVMDTDNEQDKQFWMLAIGIDD
jgi:chemotaxis response regulator CheB